MRCMTWLAMCIGVGYWGKMKHHSFWMGFWVSLFLSPIIGVIVILLAKGVKEQGGTRRKKMRHGRIYNR